MGIFKTLDLAVEFYDLAMQTEVTGHLKDQLHRAASSIALNLSEGNARGSAKDRRKLVNSELKDSPNHR